jgi:hypothetical protein
VKLAREVNWREGRRFDIKADPLRSAGDCIVPAFGSQASGSYTVLLMPKGTLEKSLQSGFAELQPPVIALAMEWLTPKARREFLRKSRARPAAAFALLDDPAVAALAATPGRNLRSFFTLAVPFGRRARIRTRAPLPLSRCSSVANGNMTHWSIRRGPVWSMAGVSLARLRCLSRDRIAQPHQSRHGCRLSRHQERRIQ